MHVLCRQAKNIALYHTWQHPGATGQWPTLATFFFSPLPVHLAYNHKGKDNIGYKFYHVYCIFSATSLSATCFRILSWFATS